MNCPKCNSPITEKRSRCERCGEELTIYRKAAKASNSCYNQGLSKAKVRDLSGAITALQKSLQLNKRNTNARNLLGLIYYEMGETVAALSEWVVSKHFQNEENEADDYIKEIQSNPTKLENQNQAIKKYNYALMSAKQGSEDLAIIQLKKVVSINSHFIRAYHLLSLLYMKTGENEKARKCLNKAAKIDINNTTTLNYLKETGDSGPSKEAEPKVREKRMIADENPSIAPVVTYKEDKPNVIAYINLFIGIVIGIAVVYVLIVPSIKNKYAEDYNANVIEYNSDKGVQEATLTALQDEKAALEEQIKKLEKEIKEYKEVEVDEAMYDPLFQAAELYMNGDKTAAAEQLIKVDTKKVKRAAAVKIYDLIKDNTFNTVSTNMYNQGHSKYSAGKYEEAKELFENAIAMNDQNVNAIYFLGRCYHRTGDNEKAAELYNRVIEEFPDSSRASEAKTKIKQVQ